MTKDLSKGCQNSCSPNNFFFWMDLPGLDSGINMFYKLTKPGKSIQLRQKGYFELTKPGKSIWRAKKSCFGKNVYIVEFLALRRGRSCHSLRYSSNRGQNIIKDGQRVYSDFHVINLNGLTRFCQITAVYYNYSIFFK